MTEDQAWDDPAPLYRPNWRDKKARESAADDWQGRALAAEAAAEGYRQRAERAEAAQREAVKAFQRERARVGRVEALRDSWPDVGLLCDCGHDLSRHNGLGCYARLSYEPLVTCECRDTDDRHEVDFAVRDLRAALADGSEP